MPRSRSQYLKFSNLCINLDLYLSSLTVIQFGSTAISSTASFFSTCMHICLNGSSTAQRWPPPPNPGCDTGWPPPPPTTWMLCSYLRSTFSMFSCSEISMAGVNLEHTLKMSDERSSQYECLWSTNGMNESKSKDRFYSALYIKFTNDKQLNARVQCKMYSLKDKNHLTWGTCLKNLHIDCKMKDGQNYIDVQQVLIK